MLLVPGQSLRYNLQVHGCPEASEAWIAAAGYILEWDDSGPGREVCSSLSTLVPGGQKSFFPGDPAHFSRDVMSTCFPAFRIFLLKNGQVIPVLFPVSDS